MNIYLFNEKKELIKSTLQAVEYIDPMTPYIPDNAVIADAELPSLAANQAHLVSGERNKDGHFTASNNVSIVADYRGVDIFNTETGEKVEHAELGDLPNSLTDKPRLTAYHTWNGGKWTLTAAAKKQQLSDKKSELEQSLMTLCDSKQDEAEHFILGYRATPKQIERYRDKYARAKLGEFSEAENNVIIAKYDAMLAAIRSFVDKIELFRQTVADLIDAGALDKAKAAIAAGQAFDQSTSGADIKQLLASLA